MVAPLDDLSPAEADPGAGRRAPAAPRVLVRSFSVPSGMPWDQARAARLEARHAAPLPIAELDHQLRRLAGWSPGRPGRYVVFYVRLSELRGPFEAVVDVDGAPTKVAFGSSGANLRRFGDLGAVAAIAAASVFLAIVALATSFAAREETVGRLSAAERAVAVGLRDARKASTLDQQARDLTRVVGAAKPVGAVLSDLAWVSSAKDPAARVAAVHWDHGVIAVEALGPASPFQASVAGVKRSPREVAPGAWLWGVRAGGSAAGTSGEAPASGEDAP